MSRSGFRLAKERMGMSPRGGLGGGGDFFLGIAENAS
jgi:hypothetical protein